MNSLKGKVVLITGSSLGIGAETAYKFAEEGCKVVVTYYKDQEEAEKVAKRCQELGAEDVLVLPLNVMDDQSIKEGVKKVVNKFGRIDILINNAGIFYGDELTKESFEDITKEIRTNLEGLIKITKECLPFIEEGIINVASQLGLGGGAYATSYSATKWGVRGFTKALAEERVDLKVYVVNPAGTATRMNNFSGQPAEEVAEIILNTAKGEYNLPSGSDINVWEV